MKEINWKVRIAEGKIATLEEANGFDKESIEDNLEIIGILENLKALHLEKLKVLFKKSSSS